MQRFFSFEGRPAVRNERLIAVGRAALALTSLFAIWVDRTSELWNVGPTAIVLPAFTLYALALLPLVWRVERYIGGLAIVSHAIDLLAYSLLISLTEEVVSPFYLYFAFAVACAALRWDWRGIASTCLAAMILHFLIALHAELVLHKSAFEVNYFIIRNSHLAVLSLLFAWFSLHQQRRREQLLMLTSGFADPRSHADIPAILREAARLADAPRAVLAWQEPEEPWTYCTLIEGDTVRSERMAPDYLAGLIVPALAEADILVTAANPKRTIVRQNDTLEVRAQSPLSADFMTRLAARNVMSLALGSDTIKGRLFLLDQPDPTSDELALGHIIAQQVLSRLDHVYWDRQTRETAAVEERLRLGRDLHDGILQSLAGAALQLNGTIERLRRQGVDTAPIEGVQTVLMDEQRALRRFINQAGSFADAFSDMPGLIGDLRESVRRDWDMALEVEGELPTVRPSRHLAMELHALLREIANNAARHAGARRLIVRCALRDGILHLSVENDGSGFPFRGEYSLAELRRRGIGPKSVIARVLALRGDVRLRTGPSGSQLMLEIPLEPAAEVGGPSAATLLAQQDLRL